MVKRVISILCVFSTVKRAIHRPSQHEEEGYGGQKEGHVPQAPSSTQSPLTGWPGAKVQQSVLGHQQKSHYCYSRQLKVASVLCYFKMAIIIRFTRLD